MADEARLNWRSGRKRRGKAKARRLFREPQEAAKPRMPGGILLIFKKHNILFRGVAPMAKAPALGNEGERCQWQMKRG